MEWDTTAIPSVDARSKDKATSPPILLRLMMKKSLKRGGAGTSQRASPISRSDHRSVSSPPKLGRRIASWPLASP